MNIFKELENLKCKVANLFKNLTETQAKQISNAINNIMTQPLFYYAYNMFIAKSEVFDAYCEWLFPILKYCEDHCGNHVDLYQNRFIGFLAERLLTVFIIANKNNLHVEVISKHFIK